MGCGEHLNLALLESNLNTFIVTELSLSKVSQTSFVVYSAHRHIHQGQCQVGINRAPQFRRT